MTNAQLTILIVAVYTVAAAVGVGIASWLLLIVERSRRERKRLNKNGVLRLIITKRIIRYVSLGFALALLMVAGLDILFTPAPRPEAGLFLLVQPLVLTGYLVFDFFSDKRIEHLLGMEEAHKEKPTPPEGVGVGGNI